MRFLKRISHKILKNLSLKMIKR